MTFRSCHVPHYRDRLVVTQFSPLICLEDIPDEMKGQHSFRAYDLTGVSRRFHTPFFDTVLMLEMVSLSITH